MGIITDITQQKRNKERYNIYVDYEYAFSLSAELMIKYNIEKNGEIDEERIGELIFRDNTDKAYDMTLNYLQYRMRSQKEIEDYLTKKGFDPENIEEVIEKLMEYDFIDDELFAEAMMRDILSTKLVGRRYIVHKLGQKGIDSGIIDSVVADIDHDSELKMAYELAEEQFRRCRESPTIKDEQRIGRLMARRGFEWHTINSVIRDTRQKFEENM